MRAPTSFIAGLLIGSFGFWGASAVLTQARDGANVFFTDVEEGAYYDDSVLGMVRKGIIRGYDDGRFGPHDFVTRAQATVMLERYDREVVQPMRLQIAKLRDLLELGRCGDGAVQIGEECDDGNTEDGDGCGAECLEEKQPKLPEAETKRCVVGGCSGQLCMEEGAEAISTCDWRPEYVCYAHTRCERQPDGECGWTETPEFLACLGHENGSAAFCDEKEDKLRDFIRSHHACRTDDDCSLLVRDCTPLLTCGNAVSTGFLGEMQKAIEAYVEECGKDGPRACADCGRSDVVCDKGQCRLDPPKVAKCGNGICEYGEADEVDPGGCGPDAPPECLGPPAQFRAGTCPEDCE